MKPFDFQEYERSGDKLREAAQKRADERREAVREACRRAQSEPDYLYNLVLNAKIRPKN